MERKKKKKLIDMDRNLKILFCTENQLLIKKEINIDGNIFFIEPENIFDCNIKEFDALIGFGIRGIDLSGFKWIHSLGAGVDWIIKNKTLNPDAIVTRMSSGFESSIFEYVLSRVLIETNNVLTYMSDQIDKRWNPLSLKLLKDMKIIILGTGSIGSGVAKGFKLFGSHVSGINRSGNDSKYFSNIYTLNNLPQYIFNEYFIVNTLPSTPETRGILNRAFFSKFKSAVFINVGRGDAVVESDLLEALSFGSLSSVWLDVFSEEPLSPESKLWTADNIHITPHIAGPTGIADMVLSFEKTYKAVINNKMPDNMVNLKAGY